MAASGQNAIERRFTVDSAVSAPDDSLTLGLGAPAIIARGRTRHPPPNPL